MIWPDDQLALIGTDLSVKNDAVVCQGTDCPKPVLAAPDSGPGS